VQQRVKPKLLVVELWGLGDLLIATPFLQAASGKYDVTLLAKPYANDLQARFWKDVRVLPFVAPWTAFTHKYRLWTWPWWQLFRLFRKLSAEQYEFGLSARWWDPRDYLLLTMAGVKTRLGGSWDYLAKPLARPDPTAHRYDYWRVLAEALSIKMPARDKLVLPTTRSGDEILIHSGAGQPVRVWPLERYRRLVARLRDKQYKVRVACDPDQQHWWIRAGEKDVAVPKTITDLVRLVDRAGAFIGNDSGPGHLAAFCGVPPFTIFGPQLPEWFAPLHPAAEWIEGKPCPYKPCSDYCGFRVPVCLVNSTDDEVWARLEAFMERVLPIPSDAALPRK